MKSLKRLLEKCCDSIRRIDRDEDGIESIQVVMILAFGAVVMVTAWFFWDMIHVWAISLIVQILGKS